MTKPRFTPDPLPDGLDPSLASFLQRQFDRINDWWPKDLEDRVKALEKSYPYIGGTWPIVDYSTVEFNGSASAQELFLTQAMLAGRSAFASTYSSSDGGQNWTIAAVKPQFDVRSIRGNGLGTWATTANGYVAYTVDDGVNWSNAAGRPYDGGSIGAVLWTGTEWMIVSEDQPNYVDVRFTSDFSTYRQGYTHTSSTSTSRCGHAIAKNGDIMLMPTTTQQILISEDNGENWTIYTGPESAGTSSAYYLEGAWYLCARSGGWGRIWRTTNAVPTTGWTNVYTSSNSLAECLAMAYGDGKYMAAQNTVAPFLISSSDGISWSAATGTNVPNSAAQGEGLDYSDSYGWIWASNTTTRVSADGVTWVDVGPITQSNTQAVRWGLAPV